MKRACLAFLLPLLVIASASAQHPDPDSAQIISTDITNFWRAYDRFGASSTREEGMTAFFEEYYLNASSGLEDFIKVRIGSVIQLIETINQHPKYYASLRPHTQKAASFEGEMRTYFHTLKALYHEAVFPDVYLMIGRMTSAGTNSTLRILIGTEMYGMYPDTPTEELSSWHQQILKPIEQLPVIVAHELVHYQQKHSPFKPTLLSQSIKEGSADFISEMIAGQHINAHLHTYGDPREEALWHEFEAQMYGEDYTAWLYNGNKSGDRPADLGYWMGYKIVAVYYEHAEDKRQAIRDILTLTDYKAFLEKSGYPTKFSD